MAALKIFIYGTLKNVREPGLSNIKEYCRNLGAELAQAGHTIVTVSTSEHVIERYVLEGMNSHPKKGNAIIVRACTHEFPFNEKQVPKIKIKDMITVDGQLNNVHICCLKTCDIALTVAGTHRLDPEIGHQASLLEKPILPLPFFDFAANGTWRSINELYLAKGLLAQKEIAQVNRGEEVCSASYAIKLLSKIVKRKRRVDEKPLGPIPIAIAALTLVTLWIATFLRIIPASDSNILAVFIVTMISSLMGVTLRAAWVAINNSKNTKTFHKLLYEYAAGLILGILFVAMWFANNLIATGLDFNIHSTAAYYRTAITCSILSILAAYFLEISSSKIRALFNTI